MATTVLIVDDHESFRTSAREVLEAEGFAVVGEAGDGASGLSLAATLGPDVVLLDVQLPDLDGFRVAAQLLAQNGHNPAVVLTSSRDASDYGTLIAESGARGFIPKGELTGAAVQALLE
jgi:DNA-binding NarL/FixJ family response regulator